VTDPTTRLEQALARLGGDHEPPEGWEARVLEATRKPKRTRWWQVFGPILALAVVIVVIVAVRARPPDQAAPPLLAVEVHKGGAVVRDLSAHVHDVVHAAARGADGHRALWIYRGGALVLACPGAAPCREGDGETIADLELTSKADYMIVALTSGAPIPVPRGLYDTDVGAAKRAGASDATQQLRVR
jgi:hypothetical protein